MESDAGARGGFVVRFAPIAQAKQCMACKDLLRLDKNAVPITTNPF